MNENNPPVQGQTGLTTRQSQKAELRREVIQAIVQIKENSSKLQQFGTQAQEANKIRLLLGRDLTLVKLSESKPKEFESTLDRIRVQNPHAGLPPNSTLRRFRLGFLRGLVRLGQLKSARPSELWQNIDIIRAAGDTEVSGMLQLSPSINKLLLKHASAPTDPAECEEKEDRQIIARCAALTAIIDARTRPLPERFRKHLTHWVVRSAELFTQPLPPSVAAAQPEESVTSLAPHDEATAATAVTPNSSVAH